MNRLVLLCASILLLLFFSCSVFNDGDWDGNLEGDEIYILDVQQNNSILTFTVTVDETARDEMIARLEAEEKAYYPPEELFFWMDPIQNNEDYYEENRFRPVARKTIDGESTSFSVTIDLKKLAYNWSIPWITEWQFDEDDRDNMVGCKVFVADGYKSHWDWERRCWIEDADYTFENSRPAGNGYSNIRVYPDTGEGEIWNTFTLLSEGLYRSQDNVLGGEPFFITLQLSNRALSGDLQLNGPAGTWYLNDTNNVDALSDEANYKYVWKIVIDETAGGDPDIVYYTMTGNTYSWFNLNYDWYYTDFYYMGNPTYIVRTDFDGNNLNFDPFTDAVYDPVPGNNWHIGEPDAGLQYDNAAPGNTVLGLGSATVNDYYDSNRNDSFVLPAVDLYGASNNGMYEVKVSFNARTALDYQYYDRVIIELEHPGYGYWVWVSSLDGPLEYWEREQNNGWQHYNFSIYSGDLDSANNQRIRLRFESDDWSNEAGVLIDDLKIYTIQ